MDHQFAASGLRREELRRVLTDIVGEAFVSDSDEMCDVHSRTTLPIKKTCAIVVFPASTAEIQQILQVATDFDLKVWPFGRGNNWGYGSKNALHERGIIMVLERMNRILEVNEELGFALIEPGVSQKQLNDHLKATKSRLWADCTDSTPHGSVLGNAIERGYGYTPYGDHFGHLCGLEVVLPSGEIIRTGGEHGLASTWNTFKWGSGPYVEGLFSQSNFGIVVKAGVWLMPAPESFKMFSFELEKPEHLPSVIDALRELALERTLQCHTHMVNDFQMLSLLKPYPYEMLESSTFLSEESMSRLRKEMSIARWSLIGGTYGTKGQVRANNKRISEVLGKYGRIEFFDSTKIDMVKKLVSLIDDKSRTHAASIASALKKLISSKPKEVMALLPDVSSILQGQPNERVIASAYFKAKSSSSQNPSRELNPARDGCGLMWLALALPATGSKARELLELVRPIYRKHGLDFSGCFTLMNPRTMMFLMGIFFQQGSEDEKRRALELYEELRTAAKAAGFRQYRLGIADMDQFMEESPATGRLLSRLKSTFAPMNILAPGRYAHGDGKRPLVHGVSS